MKRLSLLCILFLFASCDYVAEIERKAENINHYERASLHLAKENRALQVKIGRLKYDIQTLKSKNNFLAIQLEKKRSEREKEARDRKIASVPSGSRKNDLVKFDIYRWKPAQVLAMAEDSFTKRDYEKSAQFFNAYSEQYPRNKEIDDAFLFQAGIAAYQSGTHHDWTLGHLGKLIDNYPTSKYYRGAKLWTALTKLKMGHKGEFFKTVEEFRMKYRNTPEWKILSVHYEEIVQKYKK